MDSVLERYWEAPDVPFSESPLVEDVFELLHDDAEWDSFLREQPFRGREEILTAVEDWLEAGEDWRVAVEELTDAGEDRVLSVLKVSIRGKGSGVPIDQRLFTVVTVHDGKIARIADHIERQPALEAAGLQE